MPDEKEMVLLLTDRPSSGIAADLDVLYPGRVKKVDFTAAAHGADVLGQHKFVVTAVHLGRNLPKLDYGAVTEFARGGGQVVSCLFEYAQNRGLHFNKAYVA
ncbi:MAG: hypothetical protein FJ279_34255, partial [Planctomycetes bacterium]|nr:hypothetical protein [Planctomycetota bacterium]